MDSDVHFIVQHDGQWYTLAVDGRQLAAREVGSLITAEVLAIASDSVHDETSPSPSQK